MDSLLKKRPLAAALGCLVCGIILDRYASIGPSHWLKACTVSLIGILGYRLLRPHWNPIKAHPRLATSCSHVAVILILTSLAGFLHHWDWSLYSRNNLALRLSYDPSPCHFTCLVTQPVSYARQIRNSSWQHNGKTKVHVQIQSVKEAGGWRTADGIATLWIGGNAAWLRTGDLIECWGHAWRVNPNRNPGETDFSIVMRHRREKLQIKVASQKSVQRLSKTRPGIVARLHQYFFDRVQHSFDPEIMPMAQALILGNPGALATHRDKFIATGTIHLFAVSGLHVGLIAFFGHWMLSIATGRPRLIAVVVIIWCYAMFTGLRPPVMRAAVLATAAVLAFNSHKLVQKDNILCAAGIVVLLCDPSSLFQAGTQLSFLAYFVVSRFSFNRRPNVSNNGIERLISDHQSLPVTAMATMWRWVYAALWTSLIVWSATLPFVLTNFQISSWWSVILSVGLTPPLIVSLISGLASLIPMPEYLSSLCVDTCTASLALIQTTTSWCSDFTWSRYSTAGTSSALLLLLYACLLISKSTWITSLRRVAHTMFVVVYAYIGLSIITAGHISNSSSTENRMRVRFVSVGHGCCVLITFPNGSTWMYDAGELGTGKNAAQSIQSVLWHAGISKIDTLVISHMDKDHFNAIPHLVRQTPIERCVIADATVLLGRKWPGFERVLRDAGIRIEQCRTGTIFTPTTNTKVHVRFTGKELVQSNDNARSTVLEIKIYDQSLLLAGDIEGDGLEILTRQPINKTTVLLAPHHGSLHSSPEKFAAWCRPGLTIASTGRHRIPTRVITAYSANHQGLPSLLLSTHRHGCITVDFTPDGIKCMPLFPNGMDQSRR